MGEERKEHREIKEYKINTELHLFRKMSLKKSQLLTYGLLLSLGLLLYEVQWFYELFFQYEVKDILLNVGLSIPLFWVGTNIFSLIQNRFNFPLCHLYLILLLTAFYRGLIPEIHHIPLLIEGTHYLPYTLFGPLFWQLHQMLTEQLGEMYTDHARLAKEGNPVTVIRLLFAALLFGLLAFFGEDALVFCQQNTIAFGWQIGMLIILGVYWGKVPAFGAFRQNLMRLNEEHSAWGLLKQGFFRKLILLVAFSFSVYIVFQWVFWDIFVQRYLNDYLGLRVFYGLLALALPLQLVMEYFARPSLNRRFGVAFPINITAGLFVVLAGITAAIGWQFGADPNEPTHLLYFLLILFNLFVSQLIFWGLSQPSLKIYTLTNHALLRLDYVNRINRIGMVLGGCLALVYIFWWKDHEYFQEYLAHLLMFIPCVGLFIMSKLVYSRYQKALKEAIQRDKPEAPKSALVTESMEDIILRKLEQFPTPFFGNLLLEYNYLEGEKFLRKQAEEQYQGPLEGLLLGQFRWRAMIEVLPHLLARMNTDRFSFSEYQWKTKVVTEDLERFKYKCEHLLFGFQMSDSQLPHERRKGAYLLARASEEEQHRFFPKLFLDDDFWVRKAAAEAAVGISDTTVQRQLLQLLEEESLHHTIAHTVSASSQDWMGVLKSFFEMPGQKETVKIGIVGIYGALKSEEAIDELLELLEYPQPAVALRALEKLVESKTNLSKGKHLKIRREIMEYVQVALWNFQAIEDIQNAKGDKALAEAMDEEIYSTYNRILNLLALIFDSQSIALVRINLFSKVYEQHSYALELLEWLLDEELQVLLLPVMGKSEPQDKLKKLKDFYLTKPLAYEELLRTLVLRDYRFINRWTKAVAMQLLKGKQDPENEKLYLANLINPDALLAETAAQCLKSINEELFTLSADRFVSHPHFAGRALLGEEDQQTFLSQFDKIKLLQSTQYFRSAGGMDLRPLAAAMREYPIVSGPGVWAGRSEEIGAYLVVDGAVALSVGEEKWTLEKGDLFLPFENISPDLPAQLQGLADGRLFYIPSAQLVQQLMANEALTLLLINRTTEVLNSQSEVYA
ncbi:hypothetical protein PEDI_39900 [Persicobacter diffluens]|uniref:Cyclic nucleotide-binding domain-containing protein n=2 Tax=Persicobacter diffluens TaxID=981 RepID=A0AAN4W2J3_9BACT|nr:hypothetical protein PEDI_39900 [Persicobacter diffluens]